MAEAAPAIKKEQMDTTEIENRILNLCREIPKGISDAVVQNDMPNLTANQRLMVINKLLAQNKVELLKTKNGLLYRAKDPSSAKVKGADYDERMVYKAIEAAKNKGLWVKDIRRETNLQIGPLKKVLKSLENKKMIKAVKSVDAKHRNVYMLRHLEPDHSVTGGAWYSDNGFETEYVDVLNQQCFNFLEQKAAAAKETIADPMGQRNASFVSSRDLWKYITELGISKVELAVKDIECILDTLIYDGKVESSIVLGGEGGSEQVTLYRAVASLVPTTGLMRTPCGVCPVFFNCHEGGEVSPSKCIYMKEWLDISF